MGGFKNTINRRKYKHYMCDIGLRGLRKKWNTQWQGELVLGWFRSLAMAVPWWTKQGLEAAWYHCPPPPAVCVQANSAHPQDRAKWWRSLKWSASRECRRAGKMAQRVKALALQARQLEFSPQGSHKSGSKNRLYRVVLWTWYVLPYTH